MIPPVDLKSEFREIGRDVSRRVRNVLQGGRYILGEEVKQFEEAFARFIGSKYAIGVANGSDALLLSLMALGVKPGDEVITTPFTFIATVTAIARLGAKPVFVDIEPGSFNINHQLIEKKITSRTRGIITVHLYGHPCEAEKIQALAKKRGLFVVEDCAQACGAKFADQTVGTFGDIGSFSFYPTKTLGAAGDAGAVVTNDPNLYERLKSLHLHGEDGKFHSYRHQFIGINSRLDEIQAAILNVKLSRLKRWNESRRKIAQRYGELLNSTKGGRRCQCLTPVEAANVYHVYHQYTIRVKDGKRDALLAQLRAKGIYAGVYYPIPIYTQPCFEYLGCKGSDFPETERACQEVLSLPIYPQLQTIQQKSITQAIQLFFS
jgi:dTDP-4-amino-4,6-dideoxygalactose transaminase